MSYFLSLENVKSHSNSSLENFTVNFSFIYVSVLVIYLVKITKIFMIVFQRLLLHLVWPFNKE